MIHEYKFVVTIKANSKEVKGYYGYLGSPSTAIRYYIEDAVTWWGRQFKLDSPFFCMGRKQIKVSRFQHPKEG